VFPLFLVSCGSNTAKINPEELNTKLDENTKLVDVKESVKKAEEKLKKNLTGERLQQMIKKQEKWYEMIANLKWEARKKYILEKEVLPSLVEDKNITPDFCKTKDMDLYFKCLAEKNVDIEKVKSKLPKDLQVYAEKQYYYQKYLTNRKDILKATSNPIAIEAKKEVIKELVRINVLKNSSACKKIPEKEVKEYCESFFK